MTTSTSGPVRASAFAPLSITVFRWLWLASLASNIGSWMQTVGAQWFLIDQGASVTEVALVQTAAAAPVLLLGIPAGVIGELVNRRRLLIAVQVGQIVVGVVLCVLTAADAMTPTLLLALTFVLGAGSALQLPAYQALVPEIVPRELITNAAALSSIGVNVARAVGPALAGLVIGSLGIPVVFAINAASFAVLLVVLLLWRGYHPPRHRTEPFFEATLAGLRYVRHAGVVRRLCSCLAAFIVPASALWALLPLLARAQLGLDSNGYGLLLAALGVGSIGGAFVIPLARARFGLNTTVMVGSAVFGAGLVGTATSTSLGVTLLVLVVAGVAWIAVIASLNGALQSFLPAWVRSRGLSIYQLVLFGSTAIGSALAGAAAQGFGLTVTSVVAGGLVIAVAGTQLIAPLLSTADKDRTIVGMPLMDIPVVDSPAAITIDDARTLVQVRYVVPADQRASFLAHMRLVGRSRRRTGARRWNIYHDREHPDTLVEAFIVGSWREHLSQHEDRVTGYDRQILDAARRYSIRTPVVSHLTEVDDAAEGIGQ